MPGSSTLLSKATDWEASGQRQWLGMWASAQRWPEASPWPQLSSSMGLGVPVWLACSPALFCLFWLPSPARLAAQLRTGDRSSLGSDGRSPRDRTAPSAGMQPQPSLCSSASKLEGGTAPHPLQSRPAPLALKLSLATPPTGARPVVLPHLSQVLEHSLCPGGWGSRLGEDVWRHWHDQRKASRESAPEV